MAAAARAAAAVPGSGTAPRRDADRRLPRCRGRCSGGSTATRSDPARSGTGPPSAPTWRCSCGTCTRPTWLGSTRTETSLSGYRGGSLHPCDTWISAALDDCRTRIGEDTDVDTLERLWRAALALPEPTGPHVWLHSDLKPTNLLVRDGRLCAVIDFGGLTVGCPDAEHAPLWDLPPPARHAYREALGLDDVTWARARAWALGVAASGVSYYWHTFPAFVAECRNRLREILADAHTG